VAGKVALNTFGQKSLPAALPPAGKYGAAALGLHAGAEPVLAFARAFRWLISAFHRAENRCWRDLGAVKVWMTKALSILQGWATVDLRIATAGHF
jgi:hypothetical protein